MQVIKGFDLMSLHKTKQKNSKHASDVLPDDHHVMNFSTWCKVSAIAPRTGRRILKSGEGPIITKLTDKMIGISLASHRAWLAKRTGQQGE